MSNSFSERHGYQAPERDITVREDAPTELREAICPLARQAGLNYSNIRDVVCDTLLVQPDRNNWTEVPYIRDEVTSLIENCDWFRVYDIIEAIHARLSLVRQDQISHFSGRLNRLFQERGIGWEMVGGKIRYRGSESFGHAIKETVKILQDTGRSHAASEIAKALADLSRRPTPDITGAVQHAMAALEATARNVTGQHKPTLGRLIPTLNLKAPLDTAVEKLWGYASNEARHGIETSNLKALDAELIVVVAGAVCSFLAKSHGDNIMIDRASIKRGKVHSVVQR